MMQSFYLETVESTNDLAKSMLRDGQIHGAAFVVAREQTAGRGSRGRSWVSPPNAGIYLTVVDQPTISGTQDLQAFTRGAGIACAEVLRDAAGVFVRLKPINDLYFDGRKLGGILTEAVVEANRVKALITGVGINVRNVSRILSPGHVQPVSLEEMVAPECFAGLDTKGLILHLVRRIRDWNARVSRGEVAMLEDRWGEYCLADDTPAVRRS